MVQVMISCRTIGVAGLFLSGFRGVPKPLFGPSTPLSALLCVLLVPGHTVHIPGTYPTRSNDRIALWRPTVADLSPSARIARMHGEGEKVSRSAAARLARRGLGTGPTRACRAVVEPCRYGALATLGERRGVVTVVWWTSGPRGR